MPEPSRLDAQSCLDCGLVTMLAPADEVLSTAQAWAKQLAERAPIALREAKTLLRNGATQSYATTAAAEAKAQLVCVASEDSQEAIQAFMEKRPAVFKGK